MLRYIKYDLSFAQRYELKPLEVLIFTIIYAHCADYNHLDTNSKDLSVCCGCSRDLVLKTLKSLEQKDLIKKSKCYYSNDFHITLGDGVNNIKQKRGYTNSTWEVGGRKLYVLERETFPWETHVECI
jgi:transposase-like protein